MGSGSIRIVRALACAAIALAACETFRSDEAALPGDDMPLDRCTDDRDCVLAGPSCCECPTYATTIASGWAQGCANVECTGTDAATGGPSACPALVAQCTFGTCTAACAPIACDLTCGAGFAPDPSGCLTCACNAMPAPAQCEVDTDCAQVPADCCGCARGGADTAIPRGSLAEHDDRLMCPDDPGDVACPDVSTCDPQQVPRCQGGQCTLAGPGEPTQPPAGACGRPDLPPCPPGQVCTLNRDEGAGPLGLGVCEAP